MQFHIQNMTCGSCVRRVTQAITSVDPNAKVKADTATRRIDVETAVEAEVIERALAGGGYTAHRL